ncbi:hypothetical protein LR48_Vigan07g055100 [Vigna angularis]|uniref:Sororin C-terminal region domain-containing protein n=2 Tax=Phaseolus angularis TaxID=3914 RepID=A0A0L9UW86_PHAAN|nr:uncharacterized protein LOC108337438 [Vigna angularis]KAG2391150.1 uncharacterized protein HKW66_Vig0130890 [Vigna angularis]KOM46847.1 hypothetical protein LR48_Vigan07g055100 [Vigna angularis]BAT81057.1 hypothetical protein VIGAN_03071200 [Vigna angularis var. angularis]
MEANRRRRVVPRRKPLSDITNTSPPVSPEPHKTNPSSSSTSSSALDNRATESSAVAAATNLDDAPNPTSPSPPVPSTPSIGAPSLPADSITPPSLQTVDTEASDDVEASEPVQSISVVYSLRRSSNKRKKDKGKAVAVPVSTTPNLKISDSREKNDEFEGLNLSKAKALTFPRAKKQRTLSSEKDAVKDHQLQEYIEKQNAYFKEIDEFELEVESGEELD